MISFQKQGMRFNYRAAAIVLHQGRVLLHRAEHDDFWALPGGRVELCEAAADAVQRELVEELHIQVKVERLVWVVETFFRDQGQAAHELGFYFLVTLPPDAPFATQQEPFFGDEGGVRLIFEWAALDTLDTLPLHPIFLRQGLRHLPETVTHLVHSDLLISPVG